MSNKFLLSPSAKDNLKEIGRYTQKFWGISQRDIYLTKIFQCFENLTKSPLSGKSRNELYNDMRSIAVEKHVVYYYYNADRVQIVAILHESMEPDLHLNYQH